MHGTANSDLSCSGRPCSRIGCFHDVEHVDAQRSMSGAVALNQCLNGFLYVT
jgi:hypothetical protein